MYKFIITLQIKPGALDTIRAAAKPCQTSTRAEPGCISYDFFASIDDPESMVFVECFESKEAHAEHDTKPYVKDFLEVLLPLTISTKFELISVE